MSTGPFNFSTAYHYFPETKKEDIAEAMGAELVPEAGATEVSKPEPEDEATVKEALVS